MQNTEMQIAHGSLWYDTALRCKTDKVVIKLRNEDGCFLEAANIPSVSYPLNGPYKVFSYRNTKVVSDPQITRIVDLQEYRIGCCYSNTRNLVSALKAAGYNAKAYVGWVFFGNSLPTHHCWAVVDEIHLLDLADDQVTVLQEENCRILATAKDKEERRAMWADLIATAITTLPNSVRCAPLGVPNPDWLYVGSECDPEEGKAIYRNYAREHPEYEARYQRTEENMTALQGNISKQIEKHKNTANRR